MATAVPPASAPRQQELSKEETKVIFASSLGTVFEWYDFYIYGTLAAILAQQFFSAAPPYSPPSARPWMRRRRISTVGAATPQAA